jgi:hypothetical protein
LWVKKIFLEGFLGVFLCFWVVFWVGFLLPTLIRSEVRIRILSSKNIKKEKPLFLLLTVDFFSNDEIQKF